MLFLAEKILAAAGFQCDQPQDTWVVPVVLRPVVTVECGERGERGERGELGDCLKEALLQVHDALKAWGCTYKNFAIRGRYLSLVGLTKTQTAAAA